MKAYGNLTNRFEEGKNYTADKQIHVGDDITMYSWSDRDCYYVTDVIDQKTIKVLPWHVCADHDKPGGMGHQDWRYFRTHKEMNEYLRKYFPDQKYVDVEDKEQTWVYRYNKWMCRTEITKEKFDKEYADRVNYKISENEAYTVEDILRRTKECFGLKDKEYEKLLQGIPAKRYYDLSGKISFGVRDYYYDWEF